MKKLLLSGLSLLIVLSMISCSTQTQRENEPEETKEQTADVSESDDPGESTKAEKETEETEEATEKEEETADSGESSIDLDRLAQIEAADTFAVSVIESKAVPGLYDNGSPVIDLDGEDGIQLTVENNTLSKIENFNILLLCTDADGRGVDLGILVSHSPVHLFDEPKYSDKVKVMGTTTADLEAGKSDVYSLQCDLGNIEKVNAIVYSYVDADGNEIVNENCYNWLSATVEI